MTRKPRKQNQQLNNPTPNPRRNNGSDKDIHKQRAEGTGTIDLIDKCREKGLKTPEFHFDEDGQVIIWRNNVAPNVTPIDTEIQSVDKSDAQNVTPDVTPNVTPDKVALRIKNILTELMANRYITTEELAAKFKVSSRTITRNINSLRETYTIIWIPLSNTKGYWMVEHK